MPKMLRTLLIVLIMGVIIFAYVNIRSKQFEDIAVTYPPVTEQESAFLKERMEHFFSSDQKETRVISDADTAKKIGEVMIIALLGQAEAKKYMPYAARYDEANHAWWVSGISKNVLDPAPNALLHEKDGKALALWR